MVARDVVVRFFVLRILVMCNIFVCFLEGFFHSRAIGASVLSVTMDSKFGDEIMREQ